MEAGGLREVRSGAFLTAALAGVAAAIAGGVAWGLIVRWSDYEIGFAAWGIGFIVGTAVVFGAQHTRGLALQVMAVVLALFGIVLGKYLAFVWIGQDELGGTGFELPVFSKETVDLFWDLRGDIWGFWDLLWLALAVVTAFRIPQVERPQPAGETVGPDRPPGNGEPDELHQQAPPPPSAPSRDV